MSKGLVIFVAVLVCVGILHWVALHAGRPCSLSITDPSRTLICQIWLPVPLALKYFAVCQEYPTHIFSHLFDLPFYGSDFKNAGL